MVAMDRELPPLSKRSRAANWRAGTCTPGSLRLGPSDACKFIESALILDVALLRLVDDASQFLDRIDVVGRPRLHGVEPYWPNLRK